MAKSFWALVALCMFFFGCGGYTPQSDCNPAAGAQCPAADNDNNANTDSAATQDCDPSILDEVVEDLECPTGTYPASASVECEEGDWLVTLECVETTPEAEAPEAVDCEAALNAATVSCLAGDGVLDTFSCSSEEYSFSCEYLAEETTTVDCAANIVAAAAACGADGVSSVTCDGTTGSTTVICAEPAVDVAECESFDDAADACEHGLESYECSADGSVSVECAEASAECPDTDDIADLCPDGVSSYECSAEGDVSVTCASGDEDGDTDTGTETGACDDGTDNDGEGLIDSDDPDCHSDYDSSNPATYDSSLEEDLYDAEGNYSCCLDMNSDGRCTYTDGSGDIDGTSYSGAALWSSFNVNATAYDACVEWSDGLDDRSQDRDGDGYGPTDGDCNDGDDTAYPGATDVCDGYDNDCDGDIDDDSDVDGDGYADPGCSATGDDCDDASAGTNPDATDYPDDGVDQDCSGVVDDYDYDGDCYCDEDSASCNSSSNSACTVLAVGDCNDYASTTYPGASDYLGDGYDADCDGIDG